MKLPRLSAIALLGALFLASCQDKPQPPAATKTVVGEKVAAPDFTLNDTEGRPVTLSALRGKIVLLNLWATWCPPCRAEIPSMIRLNEVFSGKDFVMLAVNVDDDPRALAEFLRSHPHNFTVMHDAGRKVQQLYGVDKFPETFIIGKDGMVIEHVVGAMDWSSPEALKYFAGLVDGKQPQ